jgi:hypothetical protein
LMDSDSDECRLSILRRERIFSSRDLVRGRVSLSRSRFLERPFLRPLMEILLPKYSPLGLSYCLLFSLNSRLAVLYSNLLLDDPSVAFFSRTRVAFSGAGLLLTTRSRAELKRSAKEVSYFNPFSFLLVLFLKLAVDCLLREGCFFLEWLCSR